METKVDLGEEELKSEGLPAPQPLACIASLEDDHGPTPAVLYARTWEHVLGSFVFPWILLVRVDVAFGNQAQQLCLTLSPHVTVEPRAGLQERAGTSCVLLGSTRQHYSSSLYDLNCFLRLLSI